MKFRAVRQSIRTILALCLTSLVYQTAAAQVITKIYDFQDVDGANPVGELILAADSLFYGTTRRGGDAGLGTVFKATSGGLLTTLHSFDGVTDGALPEGPLAQAADGNLYGATSAGGSQGRGTVFRIALTGEFSTLFEFDGPSGARPLSGLTFYNGLLYGTTTGGGTFGQGTVFSISMEGAHTVLHNFKVVDGARPVGELTVVRGLLYGTTSRGGSSGAGTVFAMTPGGAFARLHDFPGGADGASPQGRLVRHMDGNLYGTTARGGLDSSSCSNGCGTIFKMTPRGAVTILHRFDFFDGSRPLAGMTVGGDGYLYGTTEQGGNGCFFEVIPLGCGTVFRIDQDGAFESVDFFNYGATYPQAGLVLAPDGLLYGATAFTDLKFDSGSFGTLFYVDPSLTTITNFFPAKGPVGTVVTLTGTDMSAVTGVTFNEVPAPFVIDSPARITTVVPAGATSGPIAVTTPVSEASSRTNFNVTIPGVELTTLHTFTLAQDGTNTLIDKLIQAADGDLYGTVIGSGTEGGGIFKITTSGALTMLHQFTLSEVHLFPWGGLVESADGSFWGSTEFGGAGSGNIFHLELDNTLTSEYSFTGGADGSVPRHDGLIEDAGGALYGTTQDGGFFDSGTCRFGCGTVFRFVPGQGLTTLHQFNGVDGNSSEAGVIEGADQALYGTTNGGGLLGRGVVFKLTKTGAYTVLHEFSGADGSFPKASLVQASDGNFYGTTTSGGDHDMGSVFRISPTGTFTSLYSFSGLDGDRPEAALIQGSDGALYGTTLDGGAYDFGTVFRLTLGGAFTTYHSFNGAQGSHPAAALLQADDGALYGTTERGGGGGCSPSAFQCGTVFRITLP
jgi:uncharacterized repeat protein (TIGR03803 family)